MHCLARYARFLPILILTAMLAVGCTPKSTTSKDAAAFMQARNYDKAVELYEQALSKKPGDKRIMADLTKAKTMAAADHFAIGQKAEQDNDIAAAIFEYEKAVRLQPGNAQYKARFNALQQRHSDLKQQHAAALTKGREQHQWAQAMADLEALRPHVHTLAGLDDDIVAIKQEAATWYRTQAEDNLGQQQYLQASDNMDQAVQFSKEKALDNKKLALHHLLLSSQALKNKNYLLAWEEIDKGLQFESGYPELLAYKSRLAGQWAGVLYNAGLEAQNMGDLGRANARLTRLSRISPGYLDTEELLTDIRSALAAQYYDKAEAIMDAGDKSRAGTAVAYYLLVRDQNLNQYWDLKDKITAAKAQLIKESELRISIDFKNESAQPGAAGYVKDQILHRLKASPLKNVRILEREALDDILREQGLGQGFLDESTALEVKKIKGIQAGIKGSVITVQAEETGRERPTYSSVKYVSGQRMVPNPEYQKVQMEIQMAQSKVMAAQGKLNAAQLSSSQAQAQSVAGGLAGGLIALGANLEMAGAQDELNSAQSELSAAQAKMGNTPIQNSEDIEADFRYEIFDLRLRGEVVLTYRVINFTTSEIGQVHTVREVDEVKDRYIPGDPSKNVPTDPNTLPTKEEYKKRLLAQAIDKTFTSMQMELSQHALNNWREGQRAEETGMVEDAIESYMRFLYSAPDLADPKVQHANEFIYENLGLMVVRKRS